MAKKSNRPSQTTGVVLEQELYDELKAAAKKSGERGVGAEIRRRVKASLEQEALDKLIDSFDEFNPARYGILQLQERVKEYYGDWQKDRFAFDVFKATVDRWFDHFQPKGEAKPNPTPNAVTIFGEEASAEKIGIAIMYMWLGEQNLQEKQRQQEQQQLERIGRRTKEPGTYLGAWSDTTKEE